MSYTFLNLSEEVLEVSKKNDGITALSHEEIWESALKYGFDKKLKSYGKTPWQTIAAQIYVDIRDNDNSIFVKATERPTRFGLKKFNREEVKYNEPEDEPETPDSYKESDLHHLLVKFVSGEKFNCHTKTICEKKSSKHARGQNEWLHPDLIGVHYMFEDYEKQKNMLDLAAACHAQPVKFYSFEMKKKITWAHLKEYFFQAVSNSSWANEGYLVALNFSTETSFMEELRRLNNAFGIGLIKLNPNDIDSSEILYPAKIREQIDWETLKKLYEENTDVRELLLNVKDSINNKRFRDNEYDEIYTPEKLEKLVKEKGIG